MPARFFSKNVVTVVKLESFGVVVSHGFVACLQLKLDSQVEMNIASLNGVKKKSRDLFFDLPIEVKNSLVSLPALVVDGLFVDVLLSAHSMKAISSYLDVG